MMRSATAFLPPSMITFMNLDSSTLPNLGSGRISRLGTSRRRGIFYLYLASVGTVSGTARAIQDSHLLDPRRTPAFGVTTLDSAPRGEQHRMIQTDKSRAYLALGFFAPYLERACLRSFTPCKSSEPRTMWERTPGKSLTRPPRTSTTL